jgi:putative glycosyltransferase (TIGR04372 family)
MLMCNHLMNAFRIWLNYPARDKLKSVIKIFIIGPIAVLAVLLMRLLNPIWSIKVGYLLSHRIGHFIANGAEFVHNKKNAKKIRSSILVTCNDEGVSNHFWKKIVSRNAKISGRWLKHIIIWNKRLPGWQRNAYLSGSRENAVDPDMLFIQHDLRLKFSEEENREGKNYLESLGWNEGDPYICVQIRDNAYGDKFVRRSEQFEHNFRNSDVNIFLNSLNWLETQGFWILRMGKLVETKIIAGKNSKIIDYANSENKSDFLDVWLFANCTGVISTLSGIDSLAMVYRKPALYLNALSFHAIPYYSDCIFAPKKLFYSNKVDKKQLNLVEYLHFLINKDTEYSENNLAIVDLSSFEILECVKEFYFHKLCNQKYALNRNQLQDKAWFAMTATEYFKNYVKSIHPECRIADSLLQSLLPLE